LIDGKVLTESENYMGTTNGGKMILKHKNFAIVVCVMLLASLSACGKLNRTIAHYRGYAEVCVHGVDYLQFSSGASVEYDREGHIVPCPTKKDKTE
jgi:hypothetical protein